MDGTDSLQSKTLQTQGLERNEIGCEQSRRIVAVPIVVKPVVVPIPHTIVEVEVTNIQVVVRVVVAYSAPPISPSIEYSLDCIVFGIVNTLARHTKLYSFFKLSYTTLSETVIADTLNA